MRITPIYEGTNGIYPCASLLALPVGLTTGGDKAPRQAAPLSAPVAIGTIGAVNHRKMIEPSERVETTSIAEAPTPPDQRQFRRRLAHAWSLIDDSDAAAAKAAGPRPWFG